MLWICFLPVPPSSRPQPESLSFRPAKCLPLPLPPLPFHSMGFSPCLRLPSNPCISTYNLNLHLSFSSSSSSSSSAPVLLSVPPSASPSSHSLSQCLQSDATPTPDLTHHHDPYTTQEENDEQKSKRKPPRSFHHVTMQRWSRRCLSQRPSFPWQPQPPRSSLPSPSHHLNNPARDMPHTPLHLPTSSSSSSSSSSQNQITPSQELNHDSHSHQPLLPKENTHQFYASGFAQTLSANSTDSDSVDVTPSPKSVPILSDHSIAKPTVSLPWQREKKMTTDTPHHNQNKLCRKRSNTELAERVLPELELQRLRDSALRMKERMKVGPAGITEAVVQLIHNKWREEEVVKLRFEGPPSLHMTRTHQILESKTGGLVIWRSGRSVVLYRGMGYEFPCVKSYATSKPVASDQNQNADRILLPEKRPSEGYDWSRESTSAATESLLDELGPRYKDWSGWGPIPVDADLLPGRIPGYKPPYRMLPFKMRSKLRDAEMTALRRLARSIAPHFALGRNREHQGLAAAIVKLWEKSAIAKIAIKRGVPNASNEIMAEEIRKLTGGTLLSRNKEYLVFYRGNDFLSPSVRAALEDKQRQAVIGHENEELSRQKALDLLSSDSEPVKGRLVAGTLAETTEAASRWSNNQNLISEEEKEAMRRDFAVSKHASLIRLFKRKLYFTKVKFAKAERALAKVQEALIPTDLPTDLETVTDEERAKFRSIGLKMNSFHLLGRRGVFDGTVQNIHLNWKHKELVKVLVTKRKSFGQVKQIAISLEAESGGVLISLDKTTKGYAIILYRGKNYHRPSILRPKNLLTRRQALERSIELQRREALKHHMWKLQSKIRTMEAQLEQMMAGEMKGKHLSQENNVYFSDESDDDFDEEGEEAYLKTYDSDNEDYNESYGDFQIDRKR